MDVCQQNKGKNQEGRRHGIQEHSNQNQCRRMPRCSRAGSHLSPQDKASGLHGACIQQWEWTAFHAVDGERRHLFFSIGKKERQLEFVRKKKSQESYSPDMKQTKIYLDFKQLMEFKESGILSWMAEGSKSGPMKQERNVLAWHLSLH